MGKLIRIPAVPTNANIVGGSINVDIGSDTAGINKRLYGAEVGAVPNTENSTLSYTVPSGTGFVWHSGFGTSDADCEFVAEVNGLVFKRERNHQITPNVDLGIGAAFTLVSGDVLTVKTTNKSEYGTSSNIEVWIYGNEYTI